MLEWQTRWTYCNAYGRPRLPTDVGGATHFEVGTVVTLKIYDGEDGKLHHYEDA